MPFAIERLSMHMEQSCQGRSQKDICDDRVIRSWTNDLTRDPNDLILTLPLTYRLMTPPTIQVWSIDAFPIDPEPKVLLESRPAVPRCQCDVLRSLLA